MACPIDSQIHTNTDNSMLASQKTLNTNLDIIFSPDSWDPFLLSSQDLLQMFQPPPPPPVNLPIPSVDENQEFNYNSSARMIRTSSLPAMDQTLEITNPTVNCEANIQIMDSFQSVTRNWTLEELHNRRRLVNFTWTVVPADTGNGPSLEESAVEEEEDEDDNNRHNPVVKIFCNPISQQDYRPDMAVVSCILDEHDNYYFTSYDFITFFESLLKTKFKIEEKNRIRRNLESFKPLTVSRKHNENFFHLIMKYVSPKPRTMEKNVKVFKWSSFQPLLMKIGAKYSVIHSPTLTPSPHLPMQDHLFNFHSESMYHSISNSPASLISRSASFYNLELAPMWNSAFSPETVPEPVDRVPDFEVPSIKAQSFFFRQGQFQKARFDMASRTKIGFDPANNVRRAHFDLTDTVPYEFEEMNRGLSVSFDQINRAQNENFSSIDSLPSASFTPLDGFNNSGFELRLQQDSEASLEHLPVTNTTSQTQYQMEYPDNPQFLNPDQMFRPESTAFFDPKIFQQHPPSF